MLHFFRHSIQFIVLLILAWGGLSGAPVQACTQPPTPTDLPPGVAPPPTPDVMLNKFEAAALVFTGRVIETGQDPANTAYNYVIVEVDTYYKGRGPHHLQLTGINNGALCLPYIVTTDHHQIFYSSLPHEGVQARASASSQLVSDQSLARIQSLADEISAPIDNNDQTPNTSEDRQRIPLSGISLAMSCSVLFLLVAGWRLLR